MGKLNALDSMVITILREKKHIQLHGNVIGVGMEFSRIYYENKNGYTVCKTTYGEKYH